MTVMLENAPLISVAEIRTKVPVIEEYSNTDMKG
jgi:hypothetical protein